MFDIGMHIYSSDCSDKLTWLIEAGESPPCIDRFKVRYRDPMS